MGACSSSKMIARTSEPVRETGKATVTDDAAIVSARHREVAGAPTIQERAMAAVAALAAADTARAVDIIAALLADDEVLRASVMREVKLASVAEDDVEIQKQVAVVGAAESMEESVPDVAMEAVRPAEVPSADSDVGCAASASARSDAVGVHDAAACKKCHVELLDSEGSEVVASSGSSTDAPASDRTWGELPQTLPVLLGSRPADEESWPRKPCAEAQPGGSAEQVLQCMGLRSGLMSLGLCTGVLRK